MTDVDATGIPNHETRPERRSNALVLIDLPKKLLSN